MTIWIKADRAALCRRRLSRPVQLLHGRRIQDGSRENGYLHLDRFRPRSLD